ncbi:MAG: class I SAM-dependent methyltransferase [Ardenticatenaceae bacterium]|nr:class I SAM-dependent methyltransferase [Ardenticatenaceae bacterium]MCB8987126.1 class I SAM-dependent methyltransferase [Ardenticatenaceae bacterium]
MTDIQRIIQRLLETNPLREPVLRSIIQTLNLPLASLGLDVGSGIGLQALLLAEAAGTEGHITGLDISPELLTYAETLVAKAGLSDRISFREGDMHGLPFANDTFDWVWSADCVGYPAGELCPILAELARIVKPGGSITILGWTSQQLLPGHPLLEARLNSDCSSYTPFLRGKSPELHFLRGLHWFREVGLEQVRAQTFVGDVQGPLNNSQRTALTSLFEMLWEQPQPQVLDEDWQAYQRLCHPQSADFVLNLPDYYAFFTYTVFSGKKPQEQTR